MRYLYSKLNYNKQTIIDIYLTFKGQKIPKDKKAFNLRQILKLTASHLLDSTSPIQQSMACLPVTTKLLFVGGKLIFVKRTQNMSKEIAFKEALSYDNN